MFCLKGFVMMLVTVLLLVGCNEDVEQESIPTSTLAPAPAATPITVPADEPVRHDVLQKFTELLGEYEQVLINERMATSQLEAEKAHTRHFYFYLNMNCFYGRILNESERDAIFAADSSKQLPTGIVIGIGPPLQSLLGIDLTDENPRENFEYFLRYSFMEIDYMSAFQITDEERKEISTLVDQELEEKGLICN